jgi:hypothetical protein
MTPATTSPSKGLDLRIILLLPLQQFLPWLISVVLVTVAGYPGVVCVTSVAWLLALRLGNLTAWRSRSGTSFRRLTEAALAGGIFGLLQGILFAVIVTFMGPVQPDEAARAIILTLIMILVGMIAGAGLSFFTACMNERKRTT